MRCSGRLLSYFSGNYSDLFRTAVSKVRIYDMLACPFTGTMQSVAS